MGQKPDCVVPHFNQEKTGDCPRGGADVEVSVWPLYINTLNNNLRMSLSGITVSNRGVMGKRLAIAR